MKTPQAKIVQLAAVNPGTLFALDSDGNIWERERDSKNFTPEGGWLWKPVQLPGPLAKDSS